MWRKGNPLTLLVGMQTSTDTMENSVAASAAAKSLQWCLTLRDPMDCSLSGPSVRGILWARVLEWGATAFSNGEQCGDSLKNWK